MPAMTAAPESETPCRLCDLPVGTDPVTDPDVAGAYCCNGCLEVARTLDAVDHFEPATEPQERDDAVPPGIETTFLAVDGMHCTTCETFLASHGASVAGVERVEARYATDTARVLYDPDVTDPEAIADALSVAGYTADVRREHEDRRTSGRSPLVSFLIGGGLFGMMVMVWYAIVLYPTYLGFEPLFSPGPFERLFIFGNVWVFTTFVLLFTGKPILRGAYVSLRARAPNMDLLVAIAAVSAYGYSTLAMVLGRTDLYFDVTVAIILVVTAGAYYEERMKRRALGDLPTENLLGHTARRPDGTEVEIEALESGDIVVVRPGERIPRDGHVVSGTAAVDVALLTGEPDPREVEEGDTVPGGAIVTDAPLHIEIEDDSTHERLVELLWSIQSRGPRIQRVADRLATVFVPVVITLAVLTTIGSLVTGTTPSGALLRGLTVMIVACPCALGLATPLAVAAGVRSGLAQGIMIARGSIFETAPTIDIVVLDKTGTLTEGALRVRDVVADDAQAVLRMAADVEQFSTHPVAVAITDAAEPTADWSAEETLDPSTVEVISEGQRGITGRIDGTEVDVGHPSHLRSRGYGIDDVWETRIETIRAEGDRAILVGWAGAVRGLVRIGDAERADVATAIDALAAHRKVVVLTGDEGPAAERYREYSGVSDVFAGVPPEGKASTVRRLRQEGQVAMVGDGSNDAPALAAADLGIAIDEGTALATDAADATVTGDDLSTVSQLFDIVDGTNRRIKQNLAWAFVYNGVAIPLALVGVLNPFFAAVAMASSSILVVANSARPIGAT